MCYLLDFLKSELVDGAVPSQFLLSSTFSRFVNIAMMRLFPDYVGKSACRRMARLVSATQLSERIGKPWHQRRFLL